MARQCSFIDYLCQHIQRFDLSQTDLHVVLPSLRMERVITRRLVRMAEAENRLPCWLPRFETINNLIAGFSGLRQAGKTESVALLYRCYTEIYKQAGEEPLPFDRFWEWGRMLVSDFNQIDNQLAPAQEILSYIAEEKRIGSWHLNLNEAAGGLQGKYLSFYQKLGAIHRLFTQTMIEEGCAYTGLAGKTACAAIETGAYPLHPRSFYLFAGLNALTAAEEKIIKTLIRRKQAEIIWNADRYYLTDHPEHEAGHFLRKYSKDADLNHFLKEEDIADRIRFTRIEMMACPQNTGQAKTAAKLIKTLPEATRTVVVLNDEKLFAPVMNALPPHLPCNVTLAGSLSGTLSGALFGTLLQGRESILRHRRQLLSAPLLLSLLRNPLFERLTQKNAARTGKEKSAFQKSIEHIIQGHCLYFSQNDFRHFTAPDAPVGEVIENFLFGHKGEEPVQVIGFFKQIARALIDSENPQASPQPVQTQLFPPVDSRPGTPLNPFEKNYLSSLETLCTEEMEIWRRFPDLKPDFGTIHKILNGILAGIGINYTGQQENSLNVMGMLETRGMDFTHAVILSMNEGTLPANASQDSFLLYSVKAHYGIPTETEQTAMQAHHFYSLLQDCSTVSLLYTTGNNNEKSRFLLQLENELPDNVSQKEPDAFPLLNPRYTAAREWEVTKSPLVADALRKRLEKGISYSSLSTWLQCPMRFFFRYVMGLGEPPQVSDELDARLKGNVFHAAMQAFFDGSGPDGIDRRNRPLTQEDVESLKKQKSTLLKTALEKEFAGGHYDHGPNLLAYREIEIWIDRYTATLDNEIKAGRLQVNFCEHEFGADLSTLVPGVKIHLYGVADRIDLYQESGHNRPYVRIIDYKTGKLKTLNPESYQELCAPDGVQALQLMLYLYLYRTEFPHESHPLKACICCLKNKDTMVALEGPLVEGEEKQTMAQIQAFLKDSITEMLNPDRPICRTDTPENCTYCDYAGFCSRNTAENNEEEGREQPLS